jgi:hypothetical protein
MSKHYPAGYRLHARFLDDEEQAIPVWAWLLAIIVISLVLIVR